MSFMHEDQDDIQWLTALLNRLAGEMEADARHLKNDKNC